jgi:hypothetical protein
MTYYPDLSPCDYFRGAASALRAVGWLSSEHSYPKGVLDGEESRRLVSLVASCWQPFYFRGHHSCEFCGRIGTRNLFVPGEGVVYVAPEMIVHYVEVHSYRPPDAFLEALGSCPEMGSDAYFTALTEQGGAEFANLTGLIKPASCPFCGSPLVTRKARQCGSCKMDWHDPDHPRKLRPI